MQKKVIFIFLALVVLSISAIGCYFGLQAVNAKRHKLASYYLQRSDSTVDTKEKILFLIKSDTLVPRGDKKVTIATLYLKQNQPDKAELYLKMTQIPESDLMLAEYYLIYAPEKASKYMQGLPEMKKKELDVYRTIVAGDLKPANIQQPETNIGRLIQGLNTQSFTNLKETPLFDPISKVIAPVSNPNNQSYLVSEYFIETGLPYLAIYSLNALQEKTGNTAPIYSLAAKAYAKAGKYNDAKDQIAKAIMLDPSNIDYYESGIVYAHKASDNPKADFWTERLTDLKKLTN